MSLKTFVAATGLWVASAVPGSAASPAPETGLLFYLSGDHGTTADYSAGGTPKPNFDYQITPIADGAKGAALSCGDLQRLAYWAPGNIYAQRGSLSFFWRSRTPVGPTPFPIFRVGYGEHSSWDMVFLRIDYNGHGFDAFVTDASLARTRVSVPVPQFPSPQTWTHLLLTWDENEGIRFYINGQLAAQQAAKAVYNAALDQFGPHSRIIAPWNVQSDYNFVRGGDIDEVRIYDHAVSTADAGSLAQGNGLASSAAVARKDWESEWALRYGWNRPDDVPPYYAGADLAVKKVEIHDAWDLKRWWWKATDGIRETTWPGVYNRSRLPGRNDYFQLPDWDCYSLSGKSITFVLPDEPWNHVEISGAAWGKVSLIQDPNWTPGRSGDDASADTNGIRPGQAEQPTGAGAAGSSGAKIPNQKLFERAPGQEITVNRLPERVGGKVQFDNVMQEEPIGEFSVYHVAAGAAPQNRSTVTFDLNGTGADGKSVAFLKRFIAGRYAPDERSTVVAHLAGEPSVHFSAAPVPAPTGEAAAPVPASPREAANPRSGISAGDPKAGFIQPETNWEHDVVDTRPERAMPIVHLILPNELGEGKRLDRIDGGLDGIVLELPGLPVRPSRGELFPLNVQVKDPLWPLRQLCDFTFSVKPGEPKRIWFDLRDRILPPGRGLYLTLAGSGADFTPAALRGLRVTLVFKPRAEALAEHCLDRFTQLRDEYAMLVEEHPYGPHFNLWNRYEADLRDLLRVDPNYPQVQNYAADSIKGYPLPRYEQPVPPAGVALWAFRQVEAFRRAARFANWWVDHRQVDNGEYGGGLSDDTDLTNTWPGIALMGNNPDKFGVALQKEVDACYRQGMITNGFPSIQADELHSYEEGTNCLGQNLILNYGSPRMIERAMENARSLEWLTGVNAAGHRHIKSSYYNGLKMATDSVWGYAKAYSYLILQPTQLLIDYNGAPRARKLDLELADGLMAHRRQGADGKWNIPSAIHFADDQDSRSTRAYFPWPLFWSAWKWTGDNRYLTPILDGGTTSIMAVNADFLDLTGLKAKWGPRIAGGERGRATESRVADARGAAEAHTERTSADDQFAWQVTGDKRYLEKLYASQIRLMDQQQYIETEGSLWIDRVNVPHTDLQRGRLGGIALVRNGTFPGHVVSWRFTSPGDEFKLAALIPSATTRAFKAVLYNVGEQPLPVRMEGWNIDPGQWQLTQGIDSAGDDAIHGRSEVRTVAFGRSESVDLLIPARTTVVLEARLTAPGTPYWQRADLGIDPEDVQIHGREVRVRVHNVGAVASAPTRMVLRDAAGEILCTEIIAPIDAPADLYPKYRDIRTTLPDGATAAGGLIELDPDHATEQITRRNDCVRIPPA